ncbi:hypothetical protein [Lysobacter sp. A289]
MKLLPALIVLTALFLHPRVSHATAQIPDEIIMNGQTFMTHSQPLAKVLTLEPQEGGIRLDRPFGECTASWRGYRATWELREQKLYLKRILINPCADHPKEVNIAELMAGRTNPIFADWFTGVLVVPQGKLLSTVHMGHHTQYESYVVMIFKKGVVVSRVELDELQ